MNLTEKGRKALGINAGKSYRHGGPEHRYWVERIAGHLRSRGYEVESEVPAGGGRTIDLVAERDRKRVAFEIETGKSDAAANVSKCLDARFDRIVVVATSAVVRDRLSRTLPADRRVTLTAASELLGQNAPPL